MKKIFFGAYVLFCIILSVCTFANGFTKTIQYTGTFKDVDKTMWYAQGIHDVFELGIMDGVSDDLFDIDSQLSVSQAITIAARLHSIYNNTKIPDVTDSKNWYDKYVNYCIFNEIISDTTFVNYSRPILSYEMVSLLSKALPDTFFNKINDINGILDVPQNSGFANDVFLFYNAGILCGNDDYGTFLPTESLTRGRAATIISRIALPENRQKFTLLEQLPHYDIGTVLKIFSYQTKKDTLDSINLMSVDGFDITGAMYRYYSYVYNGNKSKIEQALRDSVGLIRLAQDNTINITRSELCDMLTSYYTSKTAFFSSGSYYSALESNRLSDCVFAFLTVTNKLIPILTEHFNTHDTTDNFSNAFSKLTSSFDISYVSNFNNLASVID